MRMLAGFLHPDYAASLAEFGHPQFLPASQGWILRRAIPGTDLLDGMGCYPLFCCVDWRGLSRDLSALKNELVSVVLVADPLGDHTPEILCDAFDRVVPFKQHYIVETGRPLSDFVSRTHRLHALRALKEVSVEVCEKPIDFIDEWDRLYGVLAARHSITGIRRFSRTAFEKQLSVPGLVMFRTILAGRVIGLDLWYVQGDSAQSHLVAFDPIGYQLRASYASKWRALEYFCDRLRWINLGGGGTSADDGLGRFKRGWSTGTRTAWLCGRVLQPDVYTRIVSATNSADADYFPAYRRAEFPAVSG